MSFMNGESFRNIRNGFETVRDSGAGPHPKIPRGKIWGIAVLAVIIMICIANSTYEIKEQEQAVLITLGKAQAVAAF